METAHKVTLKHLDLINQYRRDKEPVNMPLPSQSRPMFWVCFNSYMDHEKFFEKWNALPETNAVIWKVLKIPVSSKELKN